MRAYSRKGCASADIPARRRPVMKLQFPAPTTNPVFLFEKVNELAEVAFAESPRHERIGIELRINRERHESPVAEIRREAFALKLALLRPRALRGPAESIRIASAPCEGHGQPSAPDSS